MTDYNARGGMPTSPLKEYVSPKPYASRQVRRARLRMLGTDQSIPALMREVLDLVDALVERVEVPAWGQIEAHAAQPLEEPERPASQPEMDQALDRALEKAEEPPEGPVSPDPVGGSAGYPHEPVGPQIATQALPEGAAPTSPMCDQAGGWHARYGSWQIADLVRRADEQVEKCARCGGFHLRRIES